ncbi:MAG: hypothetical protein JXB10_09675 [Pirellulales bacterium]|nr:hypothetical protein [Pirellulales bacterium]
MSFVVFDQRPTTNDEPFRPHPSPLPEGEGIFRRHKPMTEMLQEFCDSRGVRMRVDRQAGVIRGVKILGLSSRNGRTYPDETLARAVALYENAKVNVNHPKGSPLAPRDYQDRLGAIRDVAVRPGEGLFADLHFNPKHALAEQLAWDAEHAPENVGFSHNVEARTARRGGQVVVEAIVRVQSVDLVADPATTRGLFEEAGHSCLAQETGRNACPPLDHCPPRTPEMLLEQYPELVEEIRHEDAAEIERLRTEVNRLSGREKEHQKQELLRRLLSEQRLPALESADPQAQAIVSPAFVATALAAEDENAMRELVEERARLVQNLRRGMAGNHAAGAEGVSASAKPVSRNQNAAILPLPGDTKAFVEAIT